MHTFEFRFMIPVLSIVVSQIFGRVSLNPSSAFFFLFCPKDEAAGSSETSVIRLHAVKTKKATI
jgi:hypothetical protein